MTEVNDEVVQSQRRKVSKYLKNRGILNQLQ